LWGSLTTDQANEHGFLQKANEDREEFWVWKTDISLLPFLLPSLRGNTFFRHFAHGPRPRHSSWPEALSAALRRQKE
jgi:hypothetical protein